MGKKCGGNSIDELSGGDTVHGLVAVDNSRFIKLGDWNQDNSVNSEWPPNSPLSKEYIGRNYPIGEILPRKKAGNDGISPRMDVEYLRQAAEAHRRARRYLQSYIKPGMKMIDIVQRLETISSVLIGGHSLEAGWAFPTGCSLNNCAAHYTPNSGDNRILGEDDICKIDFGLHVKGCIVDSAFTVAFNPDFSPLVEASKEGTNAGLRNAGPDALLGEIGGMIEEVIGSYEMQWKGKTLKIQAVRNLTGHSVEEYHIHAGKSLPIVYHAGNERMEEGEIFACETFATTGKGYVHDDGECSHYMKNYNAPFIPLRSAHARELLNIIEKRHKTLAFCRRWLDDAGCQRHLMALRSLIDAGIVIPYPPLSDIPGSFTSQFEHTMLIKASGVEIITRGDDY